MARIRTIKPGFFKHETLSTLDAETQLLAAGLLCYADDEGYFNANPKLVQAEIFPLRELSRTIPVMLQELSRVGFIRLGNGPEGRTYGHVVNFLDHQVISHAKESEISCLPISWNITGTLPEASVLNGIELNGTELLLEQQKTPPIKAKSRRKKFTFEGYTPEVTEVVNYLTPKWPEVRSGDKSRVQFNTAAFAARVDAILKQGFSADQLKTIGDRYIAEPNSFPSSPHYFFGTGKSEGSPNSYLTYAKMLIHEESKQQVTH